MKDDAALQTKAASLYGESFCASCHACRMRREIWSAATLDPDYEDRIEGQARVAASVGAQSA